MVRWHLDRAIAAVSCVLSSIGPSITARKKINPRSIRNWVAQAHGAEIMRLACVLAILRGIRVCCPVHDALVAECRIEDLESTVEALQAAMAEASRVVLGGFTLRTEVKTISYPGRFEDPRGVNMWNTIWSLIADSGAGSSIASPPPRQSSRCLQSPHLRRCKESHYELFNSGSRSLRSNLSPRRHNQNQGPKPLGILARPDPNTLAYRRGKVTWSQPSCGPGSLVLRRHAVNPPNQLPNTW